MRRSYPLHTDSFVRSNEYNRPKTPHRQRETAITRHTGSTGLNFPSVNPTSMIGSVVSEGDLCFTLWLRVHASLPSMTRGHPGAVPRTLSSPLLPNRPQPHEHIPSPSILLLLSPVSIPVISRLPPALGYHKPTKTTARGHCLPCLPHSPTLAGYIFMDAYGYPISCSFHG